MSKASAEHAGQTDQEGRKKIVSKVEVLGPGQICTETYLFYLHLIQSQRQSTAIH